MFAKHYENPTMLSRVTAKNVGDVFLKHTVLVVLEYECMVWSMDFYFHLRSLYGTSQQMAGQNI